MPGAAESSLCISEKCCCEWSHASSALVDVVTEWRGGGGVTVLAHNCTHLRIFTRRDPGPRARNIMKSNTSRRPAACGVTGNGVERQSKADSDGAASP